MINRLASSTLARNTVWMMGGQGARLTIQSVYFILIARVLGAAGYGAFTGIAAFVALAAPFAGFGFGNLLIKHVSRDPARFREWWGSALSMTVLSGLALLGAALLGSHVVLPGTIPILLVGMIGASDLILVRIVDLGAQASQAFEQLGRTARLQVLLNLARLVPLVFLSLGSGPVSVTTWGAWYLASTACVAAYAIFVTSRAYGSPLFGKAVKRGEHREGLYFAVSLSAQSIYNDIDKTMLSRLSTLEAAGNYSAAYRLIDITFWPVRSFLWASNARFFQHGAQSLRAVVRYAGKYLPWAAVYAFAAGGALFIAAPYMPSLLGPGFEKSADAVRWLALIPLLRTTHFFGADALTGADFQATRTFLQLAAALFNVAANLFLIPRYSWLGAAWSSCMTDFLLLVLIWSAVFILMRRHANAGVAPLPDETLAHSE